MEIIAVVLCVTGMAIVAGVTAAIYRSLPKAMLESATHGRYHGLGVREASDSRAGHAPQGDVGSLPACYDRHGLGLAAHVEKYFNFLN
ncbi:MAG: hypothetical protein M3O41_06205 [Pseudomonadota bacterium]|nr:hypothetical protein [Pseudomonadota bacterium]